MSFPGNDGKSKMTPRKLRRMCESELTLIALQLCDIKPYILLGEAGQLNLTAKNLKSAKDKADKIASPLEHKELHDSVETAVEAAQIAFDAALNAAWQFHWMMNECKCPVCSMRRQMESADLS